MTPAWGKEEKPALVPDKCAVYFLFIFIYLINEESDTNTDIGWEHEESPWMGVTSTCYKWNTHTKKLQIVKCKNNGLQDIDTIKRKIIH